MAYFFILGHNPTLSVAEISSVLELEKIGWRVVALAPEVLIGDFESPLPEDFLRRLGGTIKFGVVENVGSTLPSGADLLRQCGSIQRMEPTNLNEMIVGQASRLPKSSKFYFGFSLYKLDEKADLRKISDQVKGLGLAIKKELKEQGINSRLVTSKDLALSSVVVKKNKLLSQGAEIVLLIGIPLNPPFSKGEIGGFFGKTLAVQEFEEYSARDYSRPERDIKSGLLPPKLAKLMINLAQVKTSQTILDPFCGSGTILQEAALLGYQNIVGSDASQKAIEDTRRNLEWLSRNYELRIMNYEVFHSDVFDLSKKISSHSIDAIVTEPYLGPLLKGKESKKQLERIIQELSELYLRSFKEFKKVLKPDGKVVMIWPIFRVASHKSQVTSHIINQIKSLGFTIKNLIPDEFKKYSIIKLTERNSVIYSRPQQRVLREILKFQKS